VDNDDGIYVISYFGSEIYGTRCQGCRLMLVAHASTSRVGLKANGFITEFDFTSWRMFICSSCSCYHNSRGPNEYCGYDWMKWACGLLWANQYVNEISCGALCAKEYVNEISCGMTMEKTVRE